MSTVARDRQTAIGAFVFGGLVLAVGAIILFGNFRLFSPVTRAAVVFQGSISGLSVGAPVTFRGVRVGAVQSISLQFDQQTNTAYIPVAIDLEPERVIVTEEAAGAGQLLAVPALVQRGLRAELDTQSFVTGQSQIGLDFAPSAPAVLHPNVTKLPEIPTRLSAIQRVQERLTELPLTELVAHADSALVSIHDLFDKLDSSLPTLVASLNSRSEELSRTINVATKAITDLQERIDDMLTHITQLTVTGDQQVSQRGNDLHALLVSSTLAVQQARETLNDLRSLTSNRAGARANLEATVRDLAAAAASMRGFANDVEHNPQLLLTGRRQ
jgi:phospholipid/cholesterol/gamma-HCH transport system substrate-binding protein